MRLSERQFLPLRHIYSWRCPDRISGPLVNALAGFADGLCPVRQAFDRLAFGLKSEELSGLDVER